MTLTYQHPSRLEIGSSPQSPQNGVKQINNLGVEESNSFFQHWQVLKPTKNSN